MMDRLVEEYDHGGTRLLWNPVCRMVMDLRSGELCGQPATARRNLWPHWSMFWCPKHAQSFGEPLAFPWTPELDKPTFLRATSTREENL